MNNKFNPPYVGAAYYPEDWPETEIDRDIRRMLDIGINMVRISEFAWSKLEPTEGSYNFSWLHDVIKRLEKNGIAVVMCTQTATPPAWLTEKYPEVLRVLEAGLATTHGGRRHYCPNSEVYRKHSQRMTDIIAKEFTKYAGVVAWQLDNEFCGECYCDSCQKKFREKLQKLYGTIENFNESLDMNLWSQSYNNFSQIPLPDVKKAIHHPSLIYRYKEFMSAGYKEFADEQIKIIRKYTDKPITTNGMPAICHRIDYEKLFENMEIVSNDLYHGPDMLKDLCFELDWMRAAKKRPYWILETSTTYCGATFPINDFTNYYGSLRAKMWLMYALGGEAVSFWPFRLHWAGQELEIGSVVYAWGEPAIAEKELKQVVSELKEYRDFVLDTKPVTPSTAMLYSYQSLWMFDSVNVSSELNGRDGVDKAITAFYRVFVDLNLERDVIYTHADISRYKVIFSPYVANIPDELASRMIKFVEAGGTWVIGPLSGFRNENATAFMDSEYGKLEKTFGIHVRHRFQPDKKRTFIKSAKEKAGCSIWADAYEVTGKNKVIAQYSGVPVPADGMPAIVECPLGKGKAIFLGTLPEEKYLSKFITGICPAGKTGEIAKNISKGIVVVPRVDKEEKLKGIIAIDIVGKGGKFKYKNKQFTLKPFDVKIIIE